MVSDQLNETDAIQAPMPRRQRFSPSSRDGETEESMSDETVAEQLEAED